MEQISRMSSSERVEVMELVWESFSKDGIDYPSPDWHGNVLAERSEMIESGHATWFSVDELQARLMSRKNIVSVLAEAASDIEEGIDFYQAIEDGVGLYFRDQIIADIRRLSVYFGEHRIHLGYFRALSSRFPYAIYYRDVEGRRQVVAVLDLRRSPEWIRDQLSARK